MADGPRTLNNQSGVGVYLDLKHDASVHYSVMDAQLRAFQNSLETKEHLNEYRVRLYNLQYGLTIVMTIIAVALVGSGIILSFMQFFKDGGKENSPSSVKISKDGLEISSSVIGLFVLVASMVFLYMYVREVYDVKIQTSSSVELTSKGHH
jgi:hypothetical protein